jgi:hypothetical protein
MTFLVVGSTTCSDVADKNVAGKSWYKKNYIYERAAVQAKEKEIWRCTKCPCN